MADDAEIRAWAKARGVKVHDRGAVSAKLRAEYEMARGAMPGPTLLPNPSEVAEDVGIIDVGEPDRPGPGAPSGPAADRPAAAGLDPDDEPPPHARREWRQKPRRAGKTTRAAAPARVLAGVRQDINAKVMFALQVPGTIWQARDPLCGGVFVQQIPETAEAFTDIICDSPDLVAFFTGPGGAFMKYLKLGAALMPVVQVTMAHHVYHSVEISDEEAEPEAAQYAA